jgi:SAM-dependent methyltransferase
MDVKEEDILGDAVHAHWYYVSKGRALRAMLHGVPARSVLDVGAGSGIFAKSLLAGSAERAVCVDPAYPHEWDDAFAGKPISFRRAINDSDADLALMMDVLEHVDDDVGLLRDYARLLAPGSHVLVTVPAFQFLFSGHDVFLEHRRRYRRDQLLRVATAAGLEPVRAWFFFGLIFPLVLAQRLMERALVDAGRLAPQSSLHRHSPAVNGALIALHRAELLLFPFNRWLGLTIFCLARVPAGGFR